MKQLEEKFDKERRHFPLLAKKVYLSSASTAAVPDYIYHGVKGFMDNRYLKGDELSWNGMDTMEMIDWARTMLASMIGGERESIAFGDNSSRMLNLLINGLDLKPFDNVILSEDAFISNKFAWQMKSQEGIELRYIKSRAGVVLPEDIEPLIDEKTKVVSICYSESNTGFKADLYEIGTLCKERNVLLCVDAVQAAGVLPIDVGTMKIDFLVGNDYKWMLGFCGTGFAYIAPDLLKTLKNSGAGWMSDSERFNTEKKALELRSDAGRFEMGYPNVAGIYGLGLAAQHYMELGGDDIGQFVDELGQYLIHKVKMTKNLKLAYDFSPEQRSSIFYIKIGSESAALQRRLAKQNVVVDCKEDCIRISLHYFNNKSDIDYLVDQIESYEAGR